MIRILVVHENAIVSQSIAAVLRTQPEMEIVTAITYPLQNNTCDILLVSATLPNDGAIRLAHFVARQGYPTKVLVIGIISSPRVILRYIEAGVNGYFADNETLDELVEKLYALQRSEFPISPAIAAVLIARLSELSRPLTGTRRRVSILLSSLTAREYQIFEMLSDGYNNRSIATALMIGVGTTKNHVHNLMHKLNIQKREHVRFFC